MKKINCILILILSQFCVFTMAQNKVRMFGYVYNAERTPASGVDVRVEGTDYATKSQTDGYFDFTFSIKDTANVRFSLLGFQTYSCKISTSQPRIQHNIFLVENSISLPTAVIKPNTDQLTSMNTLSLENLLKMPNVSLSGIESMLLGGGVAVNNELTSQYSVRGGSFDENSVYVNDIEIYRPLLIRNGQQEGLSFINPDLVSSVNFSAGGFDAKYGDKMSSVLDIKYKKPKSFEASVAGSLLGGSIYLGTVSPNKKFTQIHGVRYKTSNYLLGSLDIAGTYDQKFFDYQTYMTYQIAPKWELSFLGNLSTNTYNYIPESISKTTGTDYNAFTFNVFFDGQEKDKFQTLFGAATLKYQLRKNLSMKLIASAFNTIERVNYDITSDYFLEEAKAGSGSQSASVSVIGVGEYIDYARNYLNATVKCLAYRGDYIGLKRRNQLEWGVSFQQEHIDDRINEFQMKDSSGYSIPYNSDRIILPYSLYSENTLNSYRTQGFVQESLKLGKFALVGGLRYNYWTFNNEFLLSPRVTIAYRPKWENKDFIFRFSTGVYYQSPFYREIRDTVINSEHNTVVKLNNDIKAQRSLHFVLGSDYQFRWANRPFKFTTEIYYKPSDRVITYTVDNVKIVYSGQNDAIAYTAGVDFKLYGEFVPGTDSWINLSLMNSKEKNLNNNQGWVSRPNEQRYNFSMFFQDYFPGYPKYRVHLRFIWADGFPFWAPVSVRNDASTNRAPAYRRVDIGLTRTYVKGDVRWLDKLHAFHVIKKINVGLEVFNLLDIENVDSYFWITDVYGRQNAISNTLTGRRVNVRLALDF